MTNDIPIFVIWLTDKDWGSMPYLYEICIASLQIANPNRKVTIYSNHQLHLSFLDRTINEVKLIQDWFPGIYDEACRITDRIAHRSDIIRYHILSKQAGIYFDTDVLCHTSVDYILGILDAEEKDIMFPMEDANMICNCFIIQKNPNGNSFFDILLDNYRNRYISKSYLFNSQKYMHLMERRHHECICLYDGPTLFNPSWNMTDADVEKLKTEDALIWNGIGFHLYTSVPNWDEIHKWSDRHLYDVDGIGINKLTRDVIDKYIQLMKEADIRK